MDAIKVGVRIGRLTVTEPTSLRKNGYIMWKCCCDCGGEILLDTRCLKRETVRDCGCKATVRPGQSDISGRRFGKLTAMRPTKGRSVRGSVLWHCRCDCGNEVLEEAGQLIAGKKKSCGCLGRPQLKDFVGKRFGKLTVLEYAGKEGGMHRWRCVCDCGRETIVGQSLLQSGKTKSCGCLQATTYKQNLKLVDGTSVVALRAAKDGRLIKSNKSGHNGVYLDKRRNLWVAQITFQGRTRYLGAYRKLEEAIKARQKGEEIYYDEFLEQIETNGRDDDE